MSAENECVSSINLDKCAAILLDVAGTTTSASFVKDTLLSFVISHAEEYLKSNWSEETIKESVKLLKEDEELDISKAVSTLKTLTEKNENNKGAKLLQGHIYKKGYEDGTLKAHVFSDVPAALETWSKTLRVAIYSSGSVESQKLLFAHTTEGDISSYISQYFDLSMGSKTDSNSYKKIVKELSVTPEEVVFINDNVEEAKAAKEAGLIAVLVKREGNKEITEDEQKEFIIISSLPDLPLGTTGKRKNEDVETPEAPPTKMAKTDPSQSADAKPDHSEKNNINDEAMEVDSTNEIKDQDIKNDTEAKEETDVKADNKVTDSLSVALVDPKIYEKVGENTAAALEPMDQDVEIAEEAKEISSDVTKSKLESNIEESTNKDKSFEGKALSGTAPKCVADSTKDIETKPSVDTSQENAVLTKQVEKNNTSDLSKKEPSKTELINSDKEGLNEKEIVNEIKLSEKKVEIIKSNADEVTTTEIKNTDITSDLEKEQIKSQESKKETNLNRDNNEEEKKCTKVGNSQDKKKEETKSEEIEKKEIKTKETETKSNSSENMESEQNEAKEENMKAECKPNKDIKIDSMEKKVGCETSTTTNEIIKEEHVETECKPNIDIQVDSVDTETKSKCEVSNTLANEILKTENAQTECETSDTRTNEIIKDDICTKKEGSINNIERNEIQDEIKMEGSAETKSNTVNVENISTSVTSSTSIAVKESDSCSNENKSVSAENITKIKQDSDLKDNKLKETECNLKETKECKLTESQEVKETSSGENKMETVELIKESAAEKDIECEKISKSEDSSIDKEKVNRNDIKQSTSAEKENKCELSNGTSVENESDVNKNGDVEKNTEEEIKVKKLEEKPDSTPVSVEA